MTVSDINKSSSLFNTAANASIKPLSGSSVTSNNFLTEIRTNYAKFINQITGKTNFTATDVKKSDLILITVSYKDPASGVVHYITDSTIKPTTSEKTYKINYSFNQGLSSNNKTLTAIDKAIWISGTMNDKGIFGYGNFIDSLDHTTNYQFNSVNPWVLLYYNKIQKSENISFQQDKWSVQIT